MEHRSAFALSFLGLFMLPAFTHADTLAEARKGIQAQYDRIGSAHRRADIAALLACYTPDATIEGATGQKIDMSQYKQEAQRAFSHLSNVTTNAKLDSITLKGPKGEQASVAATVTLTCQLQPGAPGSQPPQPFKVIQVMQDTWVKTSQGWRLKFNQVRKETQYVNGRMVVGITLPTESEKARGAALVREMQEVAVPFSTVHAGSGFDDLAPLDKIIGDARIVALGEASHGTAEFFQMKHRLLEYLVTKKGFTVFAIEANWPESLLAERYVTSGEGDAASALAAMYFWTWQTEEVRDMLDWMRAYNKTAGSRPTLHFSSFDMQTPAIALRRVKEFVSKYDPKDGGDLLNCYEGMDKFNPQEWMARPKPEKEALHDRAKEAIQRLSNKRDMLIKATSVEAYRDASHCAQIVEQACEMYADGFGLTRDKAMAANVKWLAEEAYPNQKIVLWAHNGHVSTTGYGGPYKPMGSYLREIFGPQMVVFGFASDHGSIRAIRMKEGKFVPGGPVSLKLPPALPNSSEALFRQVAPRFILPFQRIKPESALDKWISKPQPHRMPGAAYDPDNDAQQYALVSLPKAYDAIIFTTESTAAKGLPVRGK
jgi:erythromycin esterase